MKAFRILLIITLLTVSSGTLWAQCSMCRAVAQSSLNDDDRKVGVGLNTGILYLMAIPYLMGGVAFGIWYKNRKSSVS